MIYIVETESFEIILEVQFTCDSFTNSSTFVSVFYGTLMVYVICVYVSRHPPIVDIHYQIVRNSGFYLKVRILWGNRRGGGYINYVFFFVGAATFIV